MSRVVWCAATDLGRRVRRIVEPPDIVLDIGCGIRPQTVCRPLVHVCCEPCAEYIETLRRDTVERSDRHWLLLNATWAEAVRLVPAKTVDTVFLLDVIEHLEKEEGRRLLKATQDLARRQIVVFTPLGFMPQHHEDGRDAWGLGGGVWQEHKSGGLPEDFGDGWEVLAAEQFFVADNMGRPLEKPFGALWAVWTSPERHRDGAPTGAVARRARRVIGWMAWAAERLRRRVLPPFRRGQSHG